MKIQVLALALAYRRKDIAWYRKLAPFLTVAYAASPIDLIPDVIPALGLLDDMLLIHLGVALSVRMIPPGIWRECREQAAQGVQASRKTKIAGAALVTGVWALLLWLILDAVLG